MTTFAGMIVAQGIPLAPALSVRLVALAVVEAVLLTAAVLLYVRWVQVKARPLEGWWAERQAQGLQARTRYLMEQSELERRAAEGEAPTAAPAPPEGE